MRHNAPNLRYGLRPPLRLRALTNNITINWQNYTFNSSHFWGRAKPNLIEWLKPYARERGPVAPLPPTPQSKDRKSQKPWGDSYWVESFNRVKTVAGWRKQVEIDGTKRWRCNYPRNAMRHSFGSYFMPTNGDDASATAAIMGNSPQVVHKHYLSLVRDTVAREYFPIVPAIEESKIIRFSGK